MTLAIRTARDWLLLVVMNLTVPVMVTWEYHTGQATRTVAYMSAFLSLLSVNIILITIIRIRDKKAGNILPRNFILAAVGLALLSAVLTSVGLLLVSPA